MRLTFSKPKHAAVADAAVMEDPSGLPEGWEAVESEDGRIYWWHVLTDATTWERPSLPSPTSVTEEIESVTEESTMATSETKIETKTKRVPQRRVAPRATLRHHARLQNAVDHRPDRSEVRRILRSARLIFFPGAWAADQRRKHAAATVLQASLRGFLVRKKLEDLADDFEDYRSAHHEFLGDVEEADVYVVVPTFGPTVRAWLAFGGSSLESIPE
jgi:hypothetical protein